MSTTDKTRAVYGIDLGTTYSCIAQVDQYDQAIVLTNFEGTLRRPLYILKVPTKLLWVRKQRACLPLNRRTP